MIPGYDMTYEDGGGKAIMCYLLGWKHLGESSVSAFQGKTKQHTERPFFCFLEILGF